MNSAKRKRWKNGIDTIWSIDRNRVTNTQSPQAEFWFRSIIHCSFQSTDGEVHLKVDHGSINLLNEWQISHSFPGLVIYQCRKTRLPEYRPGWPPTHAFPCEKKPVPGTVFLHYYYYYSSLSPGKQKQKRTNKCKKEHEAGRRSSTSGWL